jgi:aminopeptidase N
MKKSILLFALLFLCSAFLHTAIAQQFMSGAEMCAYWKQHSLLSILNQGDSPNTPKHKFDVLKYTLYLDIRNCFISPYPKSYTAYEIIQFRMDTAGNQIQLNAVNTSLQINSVSINGISFTHSSDILTITLNRTYNQGEVAQVRIDYQHLNVSDGAFYAGNGAIMTDCEPEGARKWFPCWDKPSDKALVELTAKVPAAARLGSNGRLADSTLTGDTLYYHWISRDPVSTYLIVMTGKIGYKLDIVWWHSLANPIDSIPIRFYYNSSEALSAESYIQDMTTFYSTLFGEHPFEKNGFTTAPVSGFPWGGMENQTLTTLCSSCWSTFYISHEFSHQWFGDAITCGTWADIWLNEGFATYVESLWKEHTSGYASYKSDVVSKANYYISSNPHWPMYNPSWAETTPPTGTLFNLAITYYKGGCVLHMLRYVLGDTVFFNCLKAYATDTAQFRYKNSVTDDFTDKISQVSGQDLHWFVDEWVKEVDHPIYANTYSFTPIGENDWQVGFLANQTQTTTPFHKMPLTVTISFASGPDTTFRFMNDQNNQFFSWTFDRQPVNLQFDPNNDIVLKQGSAAIGIVSNEKQIPAEFKLYQNYPNPFNPVTQITYDIPKRSLVTLKVYNAIGQLIMQPVNEIKEAGNYTLKFDASNLPSGVYYYEIQAGTFTDSRKMVLIK